MANEFVIRKGLIVSGSSLLSGSLDVKNGIQATGSINITGSLSAFDADFNSIDINGSSFVDSSRNVSANSITVGGRTQLFSSGDIRLLYNDFLEGTTNSSSLGTRLVGIGGGSTPEGLVYLGDLDGNTEGTIIRGQGANEIEVTTGDTHVLNTLTINSTLLFNKGGEQTLSTGSNVIFNNQRLSGTLEVTGSSIFNNRVDFEDTKFSQHTTKHHQVATDVNVQSSSRHEVRVPWPSTSDVNGRAIIDVEVGVAGGSVATEHYIKKRFYLASHQGQVAGQIYAKYGEYVVDQMGASPLQYNYIDTWREDTGSGEIVLDIYSSDDQNRENSIKFTVWGDEGTVELFMSASHTANVESPATVPSRQVVETPPDDDYYVNNSLEVENDIKFNNHLYRGIATPDSLFHIEGSTAGSSGGGSGSIVHIVQNTSWTGAQPYALFVEGYTNLNGFRINGADGQRSLYKASGELGFGTNNNDITFSPDNAGGTRKVIIEAGTGFLGLQTLSPSGSLDVSGSTFLRGDIEFQTQINSDDYISGILGAGSLLDNDASQGSFLEVDNMRIRSTLRTHIFKKDIVRASNGILYVSDASEVASGSATPGTLGNSFILSVKEAVFNSGDRVTYKDADEVTGTISEIFADITDNGTSTSLNGETVYHYSASLVSGSSVQYRAGDTFVRTSGGTILLDASTTFSPFIDIIESGSVKARLGSLEGISDSIGGQTVEGFGLYSDNAFLKGGIVATYGVIGGFSITSTAISSSNNELILRDNGQITGSNVLFDGGIIGGFGINEDALFGANFFLSGSATGNNFFISASNFNIKANGDVSGSSVLFDGGKVGGFSITEDVLSGANFYLSGSATGNDYFISSSNFNVKASGHITGSTVLFTGGKIGGWTIGANTLSGGSVTLNSNGAIAAGSTTFGNSGVQIDDNSGGRIYAGDGSNQFMQFDGTRFTFSASNASLDSSGNFSATNAEIEGNITASNLRINNDFSLGVSMSIDAGGRIQWLSNSGSISDNGITLKEIQIGQAEETAQYIKWQDGSGTNKHIIFGNNSRFAIESAREINFGGIASASSMIIDHADEQVRFSDDVLVFNKLDVDALDSSRLIIPVGTDKYAT